MNIAGATGAITAIAAGFVRPAMLQCFMAHIVNLVVIMRMIFIISDARTDGVVKFWEIDYVLDFFETNQCSDIHTEIGTFIRDLGAFTAVSVNDIVFKKMVELIDYHGERVKIIFEEDSESSSGFSSSRFKYVIRSER
jgi:hypothetical protein